VDQLREMMVSGIALPPQMTAEAVIQFQLARSTATHMAQLYASEGVDVVIDDVCVPDEMVDQYASLFANSLVHRVLLMPTLEALTERVLARGGPFAEFFVEYAPTIYGYVERLPLDGWIVLDTSDWSVEQTVQEVMSRIGAIGSAARTH
jgi:chloramphenicol 3-O-phosphotransferase